MKKRILIISDPSGTGKSALITELVKQREEFRLMKSVTDRKSSHKDTISIRELENVCAYASQFPADFSAMFFRGLLVIEGMNMQLTKVSSFAAWMKKNRRFL